ncbi:MAG: Mu transposase C-terminal domain-containing protein [Minicystis sp.]
MDDDDRERIALWRLGVLGPLVSARLEHGDRRACFHAAAERVHEHPEGHVVQLSARTIESWYYAYKRGGFRALFPEKRSDRGTSRAVRAEVAEIIVRAKREKPRRSIRRIIRALERAGVVRPKELTRSSVHRLLVVAGASKRPLRGPAAERRSFLTEHAGDLCIGDAMHLRARVIAPDGSLRKAYLLSQIDCATRYIVESELRLGEGAVEHEKGMRAGIAKAGVWRAYYVDRGSAYIAHSLRLICAELGIRLIHTGPGDAEAKGAIERWHRTWREEVEDELDERPYRQEELAEIHAAWLAEEYHARVHDTTQRAPREHWLADLAHLRPLPPGKKLDEVFLHRESRKVRKDGTVRFAGRLLEVRAELSGREVQLRFDPCDDTALPRVFLDDAFYCDSVPLDRIRNATRSRQRNLGAPEPQTEPSGLDPLGLLVRDHRARTRPFGAPDTAAHEQAFRRALEEEEEEDHDDDEDHDSTQED